MTQGVTRTKNSANFPSIGHGYIMLPENIERSKYIKSCYRKEKVSILLDQGGSVVFDCYITQQAIQNIKFPTTSEELGSMVCFVSQKFNNKPIIIGVISKTGETQLLNENSFKIQRSVGNNRVNIEGNGEGELFINVEAEENAIVKINVKGKDSKIELNSDGETVVNSQKEINVNSLSKVVQNFIDENGDKSVTLTIDQEGLKYQDQEGNVFEIKKTEGKINLFEGSEPLIKGSEMQTQINKLNTKFNTFLTTFTNTAVVPGDGGAALQSATQIATEPLPDADFSKIKSEKSFTE